MTTDDDPDTRTVLSWLREGAHENAERVLLLALDEVDTTPQRRRAVWPAWRMNRMNPYAKLIAATAAVLVVAIVGYPLLERGTGLGATDATPSSAGLPLVARGVFLTGDGPVELEATGEGSRVMGRMTVSDTESDASFTVDLQCARTTEDGLIMIGGYTIETAAGGSALSPEGTFAAIVLKRGSPVGAAVWSQRGGPTSEAATCLAFFDEQLMEERSRYPDGLWLSPIEGTVELGLDQPTPAPTPTVATSASPLVAPPFGLAGNGIIALAQDGDIFVADRPGGDTRPLVAGPAFDFGPVFSPDGTRMVFLRQTDAEPLLMVADADGTNVVQVMSEPLERWTFTPDSRSVIGVTWIDDEARIIVRPLDPAATPTVLDIPLRLGGEELFEWEGPRFRPASAQEILVTARLEPDGPRGIYVYDLATGAIRTIVEPAGPGWMSGVAWSPTGEDIHYRLDAEDRVVAADGSGDRVRDDSPGEPGDDQTSPWSNDGTRVVVNRESDGIADVQAFVVSTTGSGGSVQLACGPTTAIQCAESWTWSPDDSILLGSTEHIVSSYGGPMETFLQADPTTGRVTELAWDLYRTPTWQRVAP
jgi:Tol biopolymer transport system component